MTATARVGVIQIHFEIALEHLNDLRKAFIVSVG